MTTVWQKALWLIVIMTAGTYGFTVHAQSRGEGRVAQVISLPVEFERQSSQIEAVGYKIYAWTESTARRRVTGT